MKFCSPGGFNSSEQFFQYLKDSFDVLYAEGETAPKMMSIGMHCRILGRQVVLKHYKDSWTILKCMIVFGYVAVRILQNIGIKIT